MPSLSPGNDTLDIFDMFSLKAHSVLLTNFLMSYRQLALLEKRWSSTRNHRAAQVFAPAAKLLIGISRPLELGFVKLERPGNAHM